VIATPRLRLRPFEPGDADAFVRIQADWQVSRMLRMADFPPTLPTMRAWIADAEREWAVGTAYRFAVIRDGRTIGCADVDEIDAGWGDLGYWFEQPSWGEGLATEAATAVRDFAFGACGLGGLRSGHAIDNPGSGRILLKLGFQHVGDETRWSKPRKCEIAQSLYRLERAP
jgi:RimJ/RimL family protein N-acetyltransferase